MKPASLFELGTYSPDWIKDFYDQTGIWWGADPQEQGVHAARVATIERLCGPAPHRILDLGAGLADQRHHQVWAADESMELPGAVGYVVGRTCCPARLFCRARCPAYC